MKIFRFVIQIFLIFLIFSCSKNNKIEFQEMTADELSPRVEWALITDPYVACREQAGYEFPAVTSFRKGEIYEVQGNCVIKVEYEDDSQKSRKTISKDETWYALENGWVPESAVRIFSNKLKAESAKKNLK